MKAIVYTNYGSPDVLQLTSVEKPAVKDDEVLVKVHAASINSWDRDQLLGKHFLVRLIGGLLKPRHKILGADIAGRVEAVGRNVTQFQPGDEVFGDIAGNGFGGFAEYAAVPQKLLALKSPAMTFEQAASLPQAGLLALQGLRYGGAVQSGQKILINGAGGGVGTIALQYAKLCGAEVTCVDLAEKFDLLRSLGADHLIDYTKEDYTRNGRQYDLVLDVIAHRKIADYKRALKPGGTFSMIGGSMGGLLLQLMLFGPLLSRFGNRKLGIMGYRPDRNDLELLNRLFEEGRLLPVIDRCYPLHEAPDAFRYFGTGRMKGKIIITI
ncbi:NAD(P)-dependent alcohol dehydrogenase [Chitinophaga sp. XS-30]|uniref:NAD(P)-dependent alcohol dehydrogenase n=1 Tax=Chitinophaga sp. XS-30 TaxID=2604421 RepID=UPI0011DCC782|nr:NAD(P)-dependent alcohol dehydrogenase [Chitinophaga sp. XS-30]QEH43558.1 NAD(P)-dependent alcohol dehydrogenase [Chitinophaga sp. XS-30]